MFIDNAAYKVFIFCIYIKIRYMLFITMRKV